jgi:hypothetical protein
LLSTFWIKEIKIAIKTKIQKEYFPPMFQRDHHTHIQQTFLDAQNRAQTFILFTIVWSFEDFYWRGFNWDNLFLIWRFVLSLTCAHPLGFFAESSMSLAGGFGIDCSLEKLKPITTITYSVRLVWFFQIDTLKFLSHFPEVVGTRGKHL